MTYNLQNYQAIKAVLDQHNLNYQADEEEGTIRMGINIPGKVRSVKVHVDCSYDDCYIVVCLLSPKAPKKCYSDILRFVNFINYGAKYGNFELDEKDGEIRYRMTVGCEDITPSSKMIEKSIFIPPTMLKIYGEYLIDMIMEYKTSQEIIDSLIEKKT